jgi:twitching motility two-component system response regulator PilH
MKKILIIDDGEFERALLENLLGKFRYQIICASDGEEGIAKSRSEKPDLIILDVVMPRMNGFESCRAIKATPELAKIPVILLTSKAERSDEYWGRKQGADEYMTKPFDSGELLKVVFRYLSRHLLLRYEREERRQKRKCTINVRQLQ